MTMTRSREPASPVAPEAPMFEPDPELVDHLEGDVPELEQYREHVRRAAATARREWEERHGDRT